MSVYLDHNATTRVRPEAVAAVARALETVGNPSSVHAAGRAARAVMEQARSHVAALIAAPASTVIFTGGGTEANALAILSAVATGSRRLIVSAIEHDSVLESAKASDAAVEYLPVDANGVADLAWLRDRLAAWDAGDGRPFVALMLANNETGVVQPVAEAAELVRAANGWLHVDAIQAAGKIPVDSRAIGADTLAVSAHKIGGTQGVGALTFGPRATMVRVQHGGGQERGRRAGTENIPGISGFGAAAKAVSASPDTAGRDAAAARLKAAGAIVLGEREPRLPNTLCVATPGWDAERQVMALDLAGVMVSAGSACSSGKVKVSHVLIAMGHADLAASAIRVSGGWDTTEQDWSRFADAWLEAHARHAARRKEVA
ncbi:MAG: cysteine desulfurase [Alphaproteobacteria bacterium]|nr:cysteine desulfurase [Alphaproteobacteria bacterium]MBU1513534.1 cysteine desulfurase [Alphaproteobacteria bacterium]MBU2094821.1 cysteine desulfurase [Alphaproteobacteria bacterium]MBU2151078.1 cysteine desulfurase [Alphaproteobacteria bacterium]MBU2309361.1 cysteine desulfurase [Alphaproteobacteria bacterium]